MVLSHGAFAWSLTSLGVAVLSAPMGLHLLMPQIIPIVPLLYILSMLKLKGITIRVSSRLLIW